MLTAVLRAGGRLVLFDSFHPDTIGEQMAAFSPTLLGTGVPFFRAYLDAQRRHGSTPLFPALRGFVAGGAPTPAEIVRQLVDVFEVRGVLNAWGLTEFPIATCAAPADATDTLGATAGRPAPGVSVRVVDGELRLKGAQCFSGYIDASLDVDAFDDEGWFRTGDLGTIDSDGYVTITGRLKDVIIRNGENISALEIEEVLLRHPEVVDVAVLGLPDERTGERVCAVLVTTDGRQLTTESIREHCLALGLARAEGPRAGGAHGRDRAQPDGQDPQVRPPSSDPGRHAPLVGVTADGAGLVELGAVSPASRSCRRVTVADRCASVTGASRRAGSGSAP